MKKYEIIYADPPWSYNDKCHAGKRGVNYKYPTMNIDDITNLRVSEISEDDSILFMWCTWPQMPVVFDVIRNWGFQYKTIGFIWVKKNKVSVETNFWGMGNWTRSNSEICLLATKGKPKRLSARIHSIIESPIQKHSKKPGIVRDKIVELVGDLPRIELFARERVEGWDVWGNEIENSIVL